MTRNSVARTIRTLVQVVASGALVAAVNAGSASQWGHLLPGQWSAALLAAVVPVTAFAHSLLEDHGMIGTWLRQPTLTPAAIVKAARKAQRGADRLAAKATRNLPPVAAPLGGEAKAYVDAAIASLADRLDRIVTQTGAVQAVTAVWVPPVLPVPPVPPVPPSVPGALPPSTTGQATPPPSAAGPA